MCGQEAMFLIPPFKEPQRAPHRYPDTVGCSTGGYLPPPPLPPFPLTRPVLERPKVSILAVGARGEGLKTLQRNVHLHMLI